MHQIVPDLAVLFATNAQWWDYYWCRDDGPREHSCEKWTNSRESAERYGLHWIGSRDKDGVSRNPDFIHHGHSSGFCLLNLAVLMGAKRIVLLGYDLHYAPDYNGAERKIGATPRHFFGEYPSALQHWPKVSVKEGVHLNLIRQYESVTGLDIINCTPGSALKCFEQRAIEDVDVAG